MTRRKIANTNIETFDGNQISYIYHRPETYIGPMVEKEISVVSMNENGIHGMNFCYIPGLYRIINEVIDNALDELLRSGLPPGCKISVKYDERSIVVEDNGRGVPQEYDEVSDTFTPEIVFGNLMTGSNFDDSSGQELIGRHGIGVTLTNIFSQKFEVVTWNGIQEYKQLFLGNLNKINPPKIKRSHHVSGTKITFTPDWEYFNASDQCKEDVYKLIYKRLKDLSLCLPEIKVTLNGDNLSSKSIRTFFRNMDGDIYGETNKVRIGLSKTPVEGFFCFGFVNCASTNEGTHVDYVMNKVTAYVRDYIKKKHKIDVKPAEIKAKYFLFISLWMPNPAFSSQTKEGLSSLPSKFSDRIDQIVNESFLKKLLKNQDIIDDIVSVYNLKKDREETKKLKKLTKKSKKILMPKFVPAQSKNCEDNILMIGEGDSAITELINVRNPNIAGFPIRGKLLNVYDVKLSEVIKNEEIKCLIQIIGLEMGKKAKNINYGKIAFLTDMDHDGNSIAGLLINFFWKYWPELFHDRKIVRMLSPLYTAENGKQVKRFYSKTDLQKEGLGKEWKVTYHKGLGSLGPEEYELVLNQPEYLELTSTENTDSMIKLLYSDDPEPRKEWLSEVK